MALSSRRSFSKIKYFICFMEIRKFDWIWFEKYYIFIRKKVFSISSSSLFARHLFDAELNVRDSLGILISIN